MGNVGNCFLCAGEANYVHFYMHGLGYFPHGGEPRTCVTCQLDVVEKASEEDRLRMFSVFETTPEPPRGRDPIQDALTRGEEFKQNRRGQA